MTTEYTRTICKSAERLHSRKSSERRQNNEIVEGDAGIVSVPSFKSALRRDARIREMEQDLL